MSAKIPENLPLYTNNLGTGFAIGLIVFPCTLFFLALIGCLIITYTLYALKERQEERDRQQLSEPTPPSPAT